QGKERKLPVSRIVIVISVISLLVVGSLGIYSLQQGQSASDVSDREKLQGRWVLVAQAGDGEPETTKDLKNLVFVVQDDKLTMIHDEERIEMTYKLDGNKRPKAIDLLIRDGEDSGKTMGAIYSFEAENLIKLCWNEETFQRPTGF